MRIRALVARMNAPPDAHGQVFGPGSINPASDLPVTWEFDPSRPLIGTASLVIEGDAVYAEMELPDDSGVEGMYPALGGRGVTEDDPGLIRIFDTLTVGVSHSPNADPAVPPIRFADGPE